MSEGLDRRVLLGAAGLAGVAAISRLAKAGPLDPPAGAVAPTGRTLTEIYNKIPGQGTGDGRTPLVIGGAVSQVTIAQSGSYVLCGNITPSAGVAVSIIANDVTLDLNGYTLSASFNVAAGISAGNVSGITIRNGTINGFAKGITLSNADRVLIEDVLCNDARTRGIEVQGPLTARTSVHRCQFARVGFGTLPGEAEIPHGLYVNGPHADIADCVARDCASAEPSHQVYGIYVVLSNSGIIVRNRVANCPNGIRMNSVAGIAYRDNTVVGHTGNAYAGGLATNAGGNFP